MMILYYYFLQRHLKGNYFCRFVENIRMGICLDIRVNPPSLALPGSCNVRTGCLLMQLLWQKLNNSHFIRDRAKLKTFTFDMNEEAKLKFSRGFGARLLYSG